MHGKWALIRMGAKAASESKPNWLLIKEHDEFERTAEAKAITDEAVRSVLTNRDLEEIASNQDHVWNSKETASGNAWHRNDNAAGGEPESKASIGGDEKSKRKAAALKGALETKSAIALPQDLQAILEKLPEETLPEFIAPQLALQTDRASDKDGWVHELKLDGYRVEARKDGSKVQLFTRSGLDWTHRMQPIADEIAKMPRERLLMDGEVVVLKADGTTSFADLQAWFRQGVKRPLTYFVFDLLHLDGHNLRGSGLVTRKRLLAEVLEREGHSQEVIRLSEHLESKGETIFAHACELHAEGIISKRADGKYTSGRTGDWLKVKCIHEQEFVIGGFTFPSNGTHGIGALLLGYYDGGKLIYAGRTGTGFTQKTHGEIRAQLEKLKKAAMPFAEVAGAARRGAVWVEPKLVAQVNFATWTADNLVRQASFQGLREDKPAKDVRREDAVPLEEVEETKPATRATHVQAQHTDAKSGNASRLRESWKGEEVAEHAAVRLTHPNKILDVESQLTKQQLADYYWAIADHMLPQIANRPLSLVRCPEGSTSPCFFQKHTNAMLPPGIDTIDVPDKKTGKLEPYITLSKRESLAGLAQMGVLEVHPWGSTNKDLEHPDRIVIDLDPDEAIGWETLAESADGTRRLLKKLGLESFLKSTGGKGLHVVVADRAGT